MGVSCRNSIISVTLAEISVFFFSIIIFIAEYSVYLPRVQSVNTAPKLQKRLEVTMRNIKRRK
nr:MAG TPA: hypothetical protein [Caudoviricetes sp.]